MYVDTLNLITTFVTNHIDGRNLSSKNVFMLKYINDRFCYIYTSSKMQP